VVIPLLAVAGLAVPVVVGRVQQADRARVTAAKVKVAGKVDQLVLDIQVERLLSVAYTVKAVDQGRLTNQTAATDARIAALQADKSVTLPKAVASAVGSTQDLAKLRAGVAAKALRPDEVVGGYAAIITKLIVALDLEYGEDVSTPEGRQVVALDAALRLDEATSYGVTYLLIIAASKDPAALIPYYADLSAVGLWGDRLTRFGTSAQLTLYQTLQSKGLAKLGPAFADPLHANPLTSLAQVSAEQVLPALESLVSVGTDVENKIINDVTGTVEARRNSALTTAYLVGGLAVLVLLVAILLSLAVARSVVRPLTRLTASADRVARLSEAELVRVADDEAETTGPVHLEAIDIAGHDEIGDLARTFERVQSTAAGLVERQVASRRNVAQMFGHVGRRTQNLVARQVALIDRLEREETNPDRLQHLYRLDHVSSRLRRNAGSLVVLSGAISLDDQVAPMPLADIVRLALGEIEDYTRVDVVVPPDVTVVPAVVNDLVLMLAELMENATAFSPPHVRVTVSAQSTQQGVQVLVVDHGIGLSPERLAQENTRLERRERLDVVPTEVLGLFVIGRLARRHDISVVLSPTAAGGVTATVQLRSAMLTVSSRQYGQHGRPSIAPVSAISPEWQSPALSAAPAPPLEPDERALPVAPVKIFDEAALYRATRSIATAEPWSAFVPHPPSAPEHKRAPLVPWEAPVETTQPLRQRVPGTNLPVTSGAASTAVSPRPADAEAARALVEDFESGVQRAQRHANTAAPLDAVPIALPAGGHHHGVQFGNGSSGPLTRRQPGVTLEALQGGGRMSTPSITSETDADPQQVRDLVEQFEAGVTRALRDARTDQEHRRGSQL
jgi:signal transduction histidine kinase